MKNGINKTKAFYLSLCLTILGGCKGVTQVDSGSGISQTSSSFTNTGKGYVYEVSPIVATKSQNFTNPSFDYSKEAFITNSQFLEKKCSFQQYVTSSTTATGETDQSCLLVLKNQDTTTQPLNALNGAWNYSKKSDEFYEVNSYYHTDKIITRFHNSLKFAHKQVHFMNNMKLPPASKFNFINTKSFWFSEEGKPSTLKVYSKCYFKPINASFSPATNEVCLGWNETNTQFNAAQDPSIIYHELGHAFVKVLMNQRNTSSNNIGQITKHPFASKLGSVFYDEAGAINEGIADYFSHYINQRYEMGEWLSKGGGRPMIETSSLHKVSISTKSGERLSYPQFVHYNENKPEENVEDVHISGKIISHYLVALSDDLKNKCTSLSALNDTDKHIKAGDYLVMLLSETLGEIGDLTGKGSDLFSELAPNGNSTLSKVFFTNLNDSESFLWTHTVNPPNFRRFFRIFGKNIVQHLQNGACPQFTKQHSETLLDDFGLLLFKSYGASGEGYKVDTNQAKKYNNYVGQSLFTGKSFSPYNTSDLDYDSIKEVDESNRKNSVLISKTHIALPSDDVHAYLFDGQEQIAAILSNLTFQGKNVVTTTNIAGTQYNNNNIKISPGEVVGISLNLFNSANSPMGGVQVLANDWDHMKLSPPKNSSGVTLAGTHTYVNRISNVNALKQNKLTGSTANYSPCILDNFPKASEGGVTDTTNTAGDCSYTTRTNYTLDLTQKIVNDVFPKYEIDAPQPICLVQHSSNNETKWVAQDVFRKGVLDLEDNNCLNNPSMSNNNFNPNECLVRFLPGAQQSILGKINPQKTWKSTLQGNTNNQVIFHNGTVMLAEINKWIQPGTKFNCRFRARFSNCQDCFNENGGEDYPDYEYASGKGFKIINFEFTVTD